MLGPAGNRMMSETRDQVERRLDSEGDEINIQTNQVIRQRMANARKEVQSKMNVSKPSRMADSGEALLRRCYSLSLCSTCEK